MTNPEHPSVPNLPVQPGFQPSFAPPILEPATPERRRQALAMAIGTEVARAGRVESQSDLSAVIVHGTKCNHTLHLILTLVTCTMWAPVWIILAIMQKEHRSSLVVDEFGQVLVQRLN